LSLWAAGPADVQKAVPDEASSRTAVKNRGTTLVRPRPGGGDLSGYETIPWRCNGRARRGLCGREGPQSARGSETMFSGAFRALFHRPGSLLRISPPTLLFTAFAENKTAL